MSDDGDTLANRYEDAMRKLERHIWLSPRGDGTLILDIDDGKDAGIYDPAIFSDLKLSLDETNKKIKNGEFSPEEISELTEGLSVLR